ncbi:MAG: hypothetical protein ACR2MY_06945 [Candidatus Dormibacteria bacterium]
MRLAVAVLVAALGLTGCQEQALLFRNDHRITIISPANFDTVHLPLTLRWRARAFTAPTDGHYVVLVDRSPQAPGKTISEFPPADRLGIYTTDSTEMELKVFGRDPSAPPAEKDHHELTVILVDPQGRRISETAGFVEFDIQR